jgi:hypothetical protein
MTSSITSSSDNFQQDLVQKTRITPATVSQQTEWPRLVWLSEGFHRLSERFQNSWMLEYLALTLSSILLVTIFALLLHFNDKPSSTWHSRLSVNTILSMLATSLNGSALLATTSALGQLKWIWHNRAKKLQDYQMFDSASRGLFGALLLLLRLPRFTLVCLRSMIMIIALGSDASIQASTSQPLRSITSKTAKIPVGYHFGSPIRHDNDYDLFNQAFNNGLFNARWHESSESSGSLPNGARNIEDITNYSYSPTCATGNCSFGSYVSLAIQHHCSDLTATLQHASTNATNSSILTFHPNLNTFNYNWTDSTVDEPCMLTGSTWYPIWTKSDTLKMFSFSPPRVPQQVYTS